MYSACDPKLFFDAKQAFFLENQPEFDAPFARQGAGLGRNIP
jgi:hypothetical protein